MTIDKSISRWEYTGDGSTTDFPYTNRIFETTDLKVFLDTVEQLSGFTVSGVGDNDGGNVSFTVAPANGVAVLLLRAAADKQELDLVEGGDFSPDLIERELDRRTVISQQQQEEIGRSLRFRREDSGLPTGLMPPLDDIKGKFLGVAIDGELTGLSGTGVEVDVSDKTVLPVGASTAERLDVLFGKTPFTTDANTFDKLQTFTLGATMDGPFIANAAVTFASSIAQTGIIRPPQLVGNVDDYNPTGLADASIVILDASTTVNISGLAGGAVGRVINFHNISSNAITFLDQSSSSVAANRFQTNGGLVLGPNDSLSFFYDDNISRWRPFFRTWQFAGSGTQEAGTSTTLLVVPARQHRHPSACKAWINFNGTGTIAIREDYNVASITDNGVGDYTINWDVDFSNTTYCVVGAAAIADPPGTETTLLPHNYATGSVDINCREGGGSLQDNLFVNVAAFGDQ